MTPATRWCVCTAIAPARSATSAAACCGVVTTRISAPGMSLGHGDRDVAGARREVEQEDVEVTPEDVGEELLEGPVEHRSAPHDRLVAGHEHADRDDLHVVRDGRQDHLVDLGRLVLDAQHAGDREAVDVGVDDAHLEALLGEGGREVGGDRGFADAALARRDGIHAGEAAGLGEGDLLLGGTPTQVGAQARRAAPPTSPRG